MARFLVQTIPNKLPELLINLSSQGPHLMGATLSTLLRAVHPGTIAMTDFRRGLRPEEYHTQNAPEGAHVLYVRN